MRNSPTTRFFIRRPVRDAFRALVTPVDEAFFLGEGPTADDTSLIARWAYRLFGGSAEGDMRDWDTIHAWAEQVQV